MSHVCKQLERERGEFAAVERCASAGIRKECKERSAFCPLYRLSDRWKQWGIPERERRLLRCDLLGVAPLEQRLSLRVVKARVSGKPGPMGVKGTESILVLAGKCGVGKTLAATWGLSRSGGLYLTSCEFSRLGLDIPALKRAKTLVVDQLGMEPHGESGWALGNLLDVIDSRYANLRLTIICTNMLRGDMENRYTGVFTRRLNDDGIFVRFGDSK